MNPKQPLLIVVNFLRISLATPASPQFRRSSVRWSTSRKFASPQDELVAVLQDYVHVEKNGQLMQESSGAGRQLYRQQALAFATGRQYGTVRLTSRPSHVLLTVCFFGVVSSLLAFLFVFSTTRKVHCRGTLLPATGVVKIVAPTAGIVTRSELVEGRTVSEGDLLAVISNERSSSAAPRTQAAVSSLLEERLSTYSDDLLVTEELARERARNQLQKIKDLQEALASIRTQVELQKDRIKLSEDTHRRYTRLNEMGFIANDYVREKMIDLLDQKQRMAELDRQRASTLSQLSSAESAMRDTSLEAKRQILNIRRELGIVKQELTENEARRELLIKAPRNGIITATTSSLGHAVQTNFTLASLVPTDSNLQAEIYAPSRAVGFIKPGMKVLLRYQAYPYQKFGQHSASVIDVARTAVFLTELALAGGETQGTEPMYRVRLALEKQSIRVYGKDVPLKPGMLLEASVILERRRLYEWILDPLFSISGRI